MKYGHGEYAILFKALSDETRLKILTMLTKGTTCACNLLEEFHFTQPTLSYHMKQLTDSGLVNAQKGGKWVHYSINQERIKVLRELIDNISVIGNAPHCCSEDLK